MAAKWEILVEPQGRREGPKNKGGMVIYATGPNGLRQEVSRVAFIRRESNNPKNSFGRQLERELARARTACEILNEQLAGSGELQ